MCKHLKLAGTEFGEGYHVGLALHLDAEVQVTVAKASTYAKQHAMFLTTIAPNRVQLGTPPDWAVGPGRSTGFYVKKDPPLNDISLDWSPSHEAREAIEKALDDALPSSCGSKIALIWIRNRRDYQRQRNSTEKSIEQLKKAVGECGFTPLLVGASLRKFAPGDDLIEFYETGAFAGPESILRQLHLFKLLRECCEKVVSVGMQSGAMDGPALFLRYPTVSFVPAGAGRRLKEIRCWLGQTSNFELLFWPRNAGSTFSEHSEKELSELKELLPKL